MPEALSLDVMPTETALPSAAGGTVEDFLRAESTPPEVVYRIHRLKEELQDKVVILGHHYQRDDIVQFADKTGDSFELARYASELHDREYILFCGVHFMAETADVLSAPNQKVILPDLKAGCSMSDMARAEQVFDAWDEIGEHIDTSKVCP